MSYAQQIDNLLPQTQCRQCGYGGCRPYANALASGQETNTALCRPGGQKIALALGELLGLPCQTTSNWDNTLVAHVQTDACIGCHLCQAVCPTEAFLGAPGHLHQADPQYCHGCQLCISHCPTQCLSMRPRSDKSSIPSRSKNLERYKAKLAKKNKEQKDKLFAHKRATAQLRHPQKLIAQCLQKAASKHEY